MGLPGPFLTVHLTTEASVEQASSRNEKRWRACRSDLAAEGAPEEVLALVDPLIADAARARARPLVAAPLPGADREHLGAQRQGGGRLVDVLVRAAIGTGAGVQVVPDSRLGDGVGALLRWS